MSWFAIPGLAQQTNEEVIEDIKSAYENLDFPVAEARIESALASFEKFTPNELSEIYRIAALIRFADNDQDGARRQLALALQVNPELKLSTRENPPAIITLYEALLEERSAQTAPPTEIRYLVVQDPRPAAVVRSMLVPGWGQLYKKQKKKGIILVSAWGVTSAGTLLAHIKRRQAEDDYLASANLAEINDRYPAFDRWHKVRNNLIVAAAGIWLYSYIDALINMPSEASNQGSLPIKLSYVPGPSSHQLSLNYTF